jgi:hypothetical protein
MRGHIFEVLAARDEAVDLYIINWFAWAVQHPGQQPETAPVFLGKRGSGRGTLGNAMCRIFGNHGLHISSPQHLRRPTLVISGDYQARKSEGFLTDNSKKPGSRSAKASTNRPAYRRQG